MVNFLFQAVASTNLIGNFKNNPSVIVELTKDKTLDLEEEKVIRFKLRHQYTLLCNGIRYGVISFTVTDMYKTSMYLLSGQRMSTDKNCSVERGQPTKSYYRKANE